MTWRELNREKGRRLEDITEEALERLKKIGVFKDFRRFSDEAKPDFIVEESIGIECKNRDPYKKNFFSRYNVEKQIISKFDGQRWKKKVIVITKLMLYSKVKQNAENY